MLRTELVDTHDARRHPATAGIPERQGAGLPERQPHRLLDYVIADNVSAWYGLTIATCVPYDPESKGGSESSVKLAKADLVPTGHNLLGAYQCFAELEAACTAFMAVVNGRVHRETCARPVDRLEIEQAVLHPVRPEAFTSVFPPVSGCLGR